MVWSSANIKCKPSAWHMDTITVQNNLNPYSTQVFAIQCFHGMATITVKACCIFQAVGGEGASPCNFVGTL